MLDNVVEVHGLPIEPQRDEIHAQAPARDGISRTRLDPRPAAHESATAARNVDLEFTERVSAGDGGYRLDDRAVARAGRERSGSSDGRARSRSLRRCSRNVRPEMARDGYGSRRPRQGQGSFTRGTAATCSAWPRSRPSIIDDARGAGRPVHPPYVDCADRHDLAVAREQCEQRHRAELRAPLFAATSFERASKTKEKIDVYLLRAARLS